MARGEGVILPFLVPQPGRFAVRSWRLVSPTLGEVSDEEVPGWDAATSLSLSATVVADLEGARGDCQLPSDTEFGCTVRWRSDWTGLRGTSSTVKLEPGATIIEVELPGDRLGGRLFADCVVHLISSPRGSALSPTQPGARLWEESRRWTLEGTGARFPVEIMDFQKAGLAGPGAAWVVHWYHRDPDGPASSGFRLRLNSRHPLVTNLLVANPAAFERDRLASVLRRDVVRDLVGTALDLEEDIVGREWPEDTLGAVLSSLVFTLFPGMNREEVREMRAMHSADFESVLQTLTAFLSDPQARF